MYVRPFKIIDVINGTVDNVTPVTVQIASKTVIITNSGTTGLYIYPGSTVSSSTGFKLISGVKLETPITADQISILSDAVGGTYSLIICE